jgi:hypothetical protein
MRKNTSNERGLSFAAQWRDSPRKYKRVCTKTIK